jgi:hypothetical protein
MLKSSGLYLNLDDAWGDSPLSLPTRDVRAWGPRLRYIARRRDIDAFWNEVGSDLPRFVLYGSGDFHHLAGALIRRIETTPVILVSFDNHPDWDVRPPYWACGGWAARTIKTGRIERVSVWGCGNFELQWPSRLFADRAVLKTGRFEINAWAERQPPAVQKQFNCMTRKNWRTRFEQFVAGIKGKPVYVTVDLDCLRIEEATTNWENGLFTAEDVAWAVELLHASANVVGADLCGARSAPVYERFSQRFAGNWDHPKMAPVDREIAEKTNQIALRTIWPKLCDLKNNP